MATSELQPRFQSPLAPLMEQFVRTKQAWGLHSAKVPAYSGVLIAISAPRGWCNASYTRLSGPAVAYQATP